MIEQASKAQDAMLCSGYSLCSDVVAQTSLGNIYYETTYGLACHIAVIKQGRISEVCAELCGYCANSALQFDRPKGCFEIEVQF